MNLFALVALLAMVIGARAPLTYDEPYYLSTVRLLEARGLTMQFLRELPGPAGPLYTFVHYLGKPLTHLDVPGVRLLNVAMLVLTAVVLSLLVRRLTRTAAAAADGWSGLDIFCVPTIGVAAGMALTEMPAVLMSGVSFLLLAMCLDAADARARGRAALLALVGGLCLGLAIMGRQPFVLVLAALPFLLALPRWQKERVMPLALYALAAIPLPAVMFYAWHGLVPQKTAWVGDTHGATLAPQHAVLAFSYATLIFAVVAPKALDVGWKLLIVVIAGAFLINTPTHWVNTFPMRAVVTRLVPQSLHGLYGATASAAFFAIGLLFVVAAMRNAYLRRTDGWFIFLMLVTLLVLGSSAKVVHQFSSRYVTVAVVPLLATAEYYSAASPWKPVRLLAGLGVSCLSLWSYLFRWAEM